MVELVDGKPNKALNQPLLKPTRPKKFRLKMSITQSGHETEKIVLKIKNSQLNFSVPGRPPKKTTIKKIAAPKRGYRLYTPDTL